MLGINYASYWIYGMQWKYSMVMLTSRLEPHKAHMGSNGVTAAWDLTGITRGGLYLDRHGRSWAVPVDLGPLSMRGKRGVRSSGSPDPRGVNPPPHIHTHTHWFVKSHTGAHQSWCKIGQNM